MKEKFSGALAAISLTILNLFLAVAVGEQVLEEWPRPSGTLLMICGLVIYILLYASEVWRNLIDDWRRKKP